MFNDISPSATLTAEVAMRPTIEHVIVDRDGVLNRERDDVAGVSSWSQWQWLPDALDGLRSLTESGVRISVATNQSLIGRGLASRVDIESIHARMINEAASAGCIISDVVICPHAPDENCTCRKPASGLFARAVEKSGIAADRTFAIGDDVRDVLGAWGAGVTAALVRTGKGRVSEIETSAFGIPVFDNLAHFARSVVDNKLRRENADTLVAQRSLLDHLTLVRRSAVELPTILQRIASRMRDCLDKGNKILVCGNGGSAASAQHFVAELVGRFRRQRRGLAAVALTADTMIMTAVANDFGYDQVFARQVDALANAGDMLVAMSTSGNSPNAVEAAKVAGNLGCDVVSLTGQSGGALAALSDFIVKVPTNDVARIQEIHDICIHMLAELVESETAHAY